MNKLAIVGFILILLGIVIVVIAPLLMMLVIPSKAETGGVVCVVFLFIPVCYGAGTSPGMIEILMVVSVIFLILMIALALLFFKFLKRSEGVFGPSTPHHF